jgi:hypothetical protein
MNSCNRSSDGFSSHLDTSLSNSISSHGTDIAVTTRCYRAIELLPISDGVHCRQMKLIAPITLVAVGYMTLPAASQKTDEPSACVSILVYKDPDCRGDPLRAITFPTWSAKPGSPCYHDSSMPNYSVKNQRCDLPRGKWHQDVYWMSDCCDVPWFAQLCSPQAQVLSTETCFQGRKLDYCVQGPCPSHAANDAMSKLVTL